MWPLSLWSQGIGWENKKTGTNWLDSKSCDFVALANLMICEQYSIWFCIPFNLRCCVMCHLVLSTILVEQIFVYQFNIGTCAVLQIAWNFIPGLRGNVFFIVQAPHDGMSTKIQHLTIDCPHGDAGAASAVLPHWSSFYTSGEDVCSFWGGVGRCESKNINITMWGVSCNMAVTWKNAIFSMSID